MRKIPWRRVGIAIAGAIVAVFVALTVLDVVGVIGDDSPSETIEDNAVIARRVLETVSDEGLPIPPSELGLAPRSEAVRQYRCTEGDSVPSDASLSRFYYSTRSLTTSDLDTLSAGWIERGWTPEKSELPESRVFSKTVRDEPVEAVVTLESAQSGTEGSVVSVHVQLADRFVCKYYDELEN